ncbi:MAG: hypothetical protein IPM33_05370 [Phycisphaerales bacterium]|nr:hypothetical protein [Phycisphaerales bacterium]
MAKMFYSIEEAASKLGKSEDQIRDLVARGQLQEFRDRDKLMFKREQVDLLAGGDDDVIPLAGDSGELTPMTSPGASGTGLGLAGDKKDSTGISIFEADETEEADPSAVTRVSASPSIVDPGEKSGSGGLLDLTKEADDTSLGAGLLDDVYGSDTIAAQTAAEPAISGEGALFESHAGESNEPAAMPMMMVAEVYDGAGSGLVGGFSLGMIASVMIAGFVLLVGLTTTAGGGLLNAVGENFMILVGAMALVTLLGAGIGFFLGKRS